MDTQLITIYCFSGDLLQALNHTEDQQRQMSDAEVMTTALAAARFLRGNFAMARLFLREQGYIPTMVSKGTFSTRLHRLREYFGLLFQALLPPLIRAFSYAPGRQRSAVLRCSNVKYCRPLRRSRWRANDQAWNRR